jgi:2-phosphosulfolactate phosphatase
VRVHVAFTPDEAAAAPTGVVIDVIRATSTICQALASGYERVWCAAEVEDARSLAGAGVTLGGERLGVRIEGFDLGNSPREYLEPRTPTLAMSTTNGTRAIVTAAERCDRVLIASLLNLAAVTEAAAAHGEDVAVFCAGVKGAFALDDAYVAGRIVEGLGGGGGESPESRASPKPVERTDAAEAAVRLARSYASAEDAFRASRSGRNLINHGAELEADIPWCARESVLDVVPRFAGTHGVAAEIVGGG